MLGIINSVVGNDTEVEVENPEAGGKRIGIARKVLTMKNKVICLKVRAECFIIIIKFGKKIEGSNQFKQMKCTDP
jgi:non-homologous end joining protein Ku